MPHSPAQGRLKAVNQAGMDHSTAWWSWDQLQLLQFELSGEKELVSNVCSFSAQLLSLAMDFTCHGGTYCYKR